MSFLMDGRNTATIFINRGAGKFNPNHRKENNFTAEYAAIDPETGRALVSLRVYWTDARCYAAIWARNYDGVELSGSGFAGGYGYCKESQAAANAIDAANIGLSENIGGRGTNSIMYAVKAIAVALGVDNPIIHKSHA